MARKMRIIVFILLLSATTGAYAYVGPGLGLGVLGALFGAIATVLLAVVGLVWYPMKRLIKRMKGDKANVDEGKSEEREQSKNQEVDQSNDA
jgi:uncharacterized membrane-anchored protein